MAKKQQELKVLTADVKDLMNQILIKLESVEAYTVPFDGDGYPQYNEYIEEGDEDDDGNPIEKKSDQELYLGCVKNYLQLAIKDKDGQSVEQVERKYHTSTCY